MRRARKSEYKLESTGDMLCIKHCATVHAIRPCYSGAFAHTIQSPQTRIKPEGARTTPYGLERRNISSLIRPLSKLAPGSDLKVRAGGWSVAKATVGGAPWMYAGGGYY